MPGKYPPREPVSLGECRMADNPAADVVDTDGQVFDRPGLCVLGRAILSAATGVNPSHRVIAAARPLLSIRHGISFNETMRERDLIHTGQGAGPPLRPVSFTVIVTIADREAFLAGPLRNGQQWALHGSTNIWHRHGPDIWPATRFWAGAVLRAFTSPGGPGPATQAAVSHHREIP